LYFFGGGETGIWIQGFVLAKQVFYCLSHTFSPFCPGYFGDGVSGWPQTMILLISASQVARITGVSSWRLTQYFFF
jgi:hypothetical protein